MAQTGVAGSNEFPLINIRLVPYTVGSFPWDEVDVFVS